MKTKQLYPSIYKAALEMSYCNGGINRTRSERVFENQLNKFLEEFIQYPICNKDDLPNIDKWLETLTNDELMLFVDGEERERDKMINDKEAPLLVHLLFDNIFNEVG